MKRSRAVVLGCNGLLGQRVSEFLARGTSHELLLTSRQDEPVLRIPDSSFRKLDITKKTDVRSIIDEFRPQIILNAAAMTQVDTCETDRELAWKSNVTAVENIVDAAKRVEATVVHLSTDYVFDGKDGPYAEDARPNPVNYYGRAKLASENLLKSAGVRHIIARTIVLYGSGIRVKSNFALWLVDSLGAGKHVNIVDDQMGNPTLVDDLAHALVSAIELGKEGLFHVAGREVVSRFEFAVKLAEVFGFDARLIKAIKTSSLKQPAPRPLKSGLVTLKAEVELGYKPSTMEEGLMILKSQLSRGSKRLPDSAPVPGRKQ